MIEDDILFTSNNISFNVCVTVWKILGFGNFGGTFANPTFLSSFFFKNNNNKLFKKIHNQ